jgi:DNA-binding response OmpR family regulator
MQSYSGSSQRILVVDDHPFISELLSQAFRQQGYDMRTAYSAELALKLIENWQPDLAILDVHLSKMNGIDLAFRIREIHPDCKLLLFSGLSSDDPLIARAQESGLRCAYLSKPAHPDILLTTVRQLLKPSSLF